MLALDQSFTIDFPLELTVDVPLGGASDSSFTDAADFTDCDRTAAPAGQGPQIDL